MSENEVSEEALAESLLASETDDIESGVEGTLDEDTLAESLLEPEEAPEEDTPAEEPEGSDEEDEPAAEDESDEDEAGEEEAEDEEADDEAEEDTEEAEEEEPDEDQYVFHDPEGNGITLEEARRGYLRQADYTQKTQQLSEQARQVDQAAEHVVRERETLAEHLNLAMMVIEPQLAELSSLNWDDLATNDPETYTQARAQWDLANTRYQQLTEAAQAVLAEDQNAKQQRLAQQRQAETEKLRMAIPEMADPKAAPKLGAAIRDYAVETIGLTEHEVSNIYDHRLIVALDKARKYDALESGKLTVAKKKVAKGPGKVIKSGQPQTSAQKAAKAAKAKEAAWRSVSEPGDQEEAYADFLLQG